MPKYIGAIDQGTTSSRFILFDRHGSLIASHQEKLPNIFPQPGWQEQDPTAILGTVETCIAKVMEKYESKDVVAIGITNQRETLVAWDRFTGKPLNNAIVWSDLRTVDICQELEKKYGGREAFRDNTGLPISTYFSATKLLWMLKHAEEVKKAADEGRVMFGTVDSWLLYNLSGGATKKKTINNNNNNNNNININNNNNNDRLGVHITDVSNASRTMLMSLSSRSWCEKTCTLLGINVDWLPTIKSNSEILAYVAQGPLKGVPISGMIGDQQAALLGQLCTHPGHAKNTYGTGCFMLMHTGEKIVPSKHGLLTTVGYQLGPSSSCQYALEGSVAVAGAAMTWLQESLQVINSPKHFDQLAESVKDNGGVYFVPAFSGLLSPYWRDDARGTIVGLTRFATRAHLCRATLEAAAYQTKDVITAMEEDSGSKVIGLKVDGGMSRSQLMCQFQSDVLGIPVYKPTMDERTALGAAFAAGLAQGVNMWKDIDDLVKSTTDETSNNATSSTSLPLSSKSKSSASSSISKDPAFKTYSPRINDDQRQDLLGKWKKAIERSLGWEQSKL